VDFEGKGVTAGDQSCRRKRSVLCDSDIAHVHCIGIPPSKCTLDEKYGEREEERGVRGGRRKEGRRSTGGPI